MSEFRAKLNERMFRQELELLKVSMSRINPEKISRFQVRKLLGNLTTVSDKAERSIKEYVALGNERRAGVLIDDTIDVHKLAYDILPELAVKEAMLSEEKFERRVTSIQRSQRLKDSYADLISLRARKKEAKSKQR